MLRAHAPSLVVLHDAVHARRLQPATKPPCARLVRAAAAYGAGQQRSSTRCRPSGPGLAAQPPPAQPASSLVSWHDPWARWRARAVVVRRGATPTKAAAGGVQNLARRLAVVAAPCAVAGSPAMVAIMAVD